MAFGIKQAARAHLRVERPGVRSHSEACVSLPERLSRWRRSSEPSLFSAAASAKAFFCPSGITCFGHSTRSVRFHRTKNMPVVLQLRDGPNSNDIAGSWQKSLHFGSKTVIGARLGDHVERLSYSRFSRSFRRLGDDTKLRMSLDLSDSQNASRFSMKLASCEASLLYGSAGLFVSCS